jgi:hypothetical protein
MTLKPFAVKILCAKKTDIRLNGQPRRQMKVLSVGEQVAQMLANDKTRDLMQYRHNYEAIDGRFKDYFDGAAYKFFQKTPICSLAKTMLQ